MCADGSYSSSPVPPEEDRRVKLFGLTQLFTSSVLIVTGLRMAALRNAVSPDFTYSQSYLSLLSASGCMTGIICCASPTVWAIMQKVVHNRHLRWATDRVRDLQVYVSGPTARGQTGTRTQLRQERGDSDRDVEKGSDSCTDTDGDGERSPQDDMTIGHTTTLPSENEVHFWAVASFDFDGSYDSELSIVKGELVWILYKRDQGWLVAQNAADEIGLVPETYVDLSGYDDRNRAERVQVSQALLSRAGLGHVEFSHQ